MGPIARCSTARSSSLIRLFEERTSVDRGCADQAMRNLVADLKRSVKREILAVEVNNHFVKRNVFHLDIAPGLSSDGYVEPLGNDFRAGFRIVLREESALTRTRFTIAHELCHTFFYEFVPELKYGSSETDPEEERLCNLGAGELLMPGRALKKLARTHTVSMDSLEKLASSYIVSPEAMLVRLRALKLWNCELSYWRPKRGGFSLDRIVGRRKLDWVWPDDSALQSAWRRKFEITGHTYVELRSPEGGRQVRHVFFEVARRGDRLMVLWDAKPFKQKLRRLPLFESQGLSTKN
jgi:IrrE N-terminal-like domain